MAVAQVNHCCVPHLTIVVVTVIVVCRCAALICVSMWKELAVMVDDDVVLHSVANVFDLCVPMVVVCMGECSCSCVGCAVQRDLRDDNRVLARLAGILDSNVMEAVN